MAYQFDPITLEVLWRRLISIVDEAEGTVARTAFSSLLRATHDYTCMFTDRKGRELAQGTFAPPGQSGAIALGIKNLVKKLPLDHYKAGDTVVMDAAGGGDYGIPTERDEEMVLDDVRNVYVSVEEARDEYGVVIDPQTLELMPDETRALRGSSK